jgi:hypothetical protein
MADDHSTGNSCPRKIPNERRITVGKLFYDYPPRKEDPPGMPKRSVVVPWVQMKGRWLARPGSISGCRCASGSCTAVWS